ncbi:DUF5047 domain-containing protein [Crossiella sp. CA-258035]|uniref:DUF5047 domain-containing protein n=1 Tax=Crossiella sp. CA-258035 TaxID=2981138 RepID=UPI0024BCC319|nr:DUF5047 domain-containing protein [Crossiella sp. CA-258035]WHT21026.1 DUF5047 domain-containing protein [Crossiella sp. CA-258035]
MQGLSVAATQTLPVSHGIAVRVSSKSPTQGTLYDVPVIDGVVSVDPGSQVRRTARLVLEPALWPVAPASHFSPISSRIFIEYGIQLPWGDLEWIPVFTGRVQTAKRSNDGAVELTAADLSRLVAEDRLDSPGQTVTSATKVAEITRLIQETIPGQVVIDQTGSTAACPQIQIERERWSDGVEKIADSLGAEVFCDPLGRFVIRPQPTLDGPAVWGINCGDDGTLLELSEETTRERVYNRVIAMGQRSDDTPPVRAVVSDTDPESPTFYGGAFGKKPRFYSSPLLTTVAQCTDTATSILNRAKGIDGSISLDAVCNPALDSGDIVSVRYRDGSVGLHIIDALEIPLSINGVQRILTRTVELPGESG